MRIDILVSAIPKGINELEMAIEERNLINDIARLLSDKGYKYAIADSDVIRDDVKTRVVLD
jgi:hypothetical protein